MKDFKLMNTLTTSPIKLDKDNRDTSIYVTKYRCTIKFLLYLTTSRPNIMFSVYLYSKFQYDPKESFQRYCSTRTLGFRYLKGTHIDLFSYLDANQTGCTIDHKCTSKECYLFQIFHFYHDLVRNKIWLRGLPSEPNISPSLVVVHKYMDEKTLNDYHLSFDHMPIMCDNTSAIYLSKNSILPS